MPHADDPALLMLIALVGAHYFFDYAGQGDFMSRAKNSSAPIPGVPWYHVLAGHAWIHGAAVAVITQIWWLFVLEYLVHFLTDKAKCRNWIGFAADQWIHLGSKVIWWLVALDYWRYHA